MLITSETPSDVLLEDLRARSGWSVRPALLITTWVALILIALCGIGIIAGMLGAMARRNGVQLAVAPIAAILSLLGTGLTLMLLDPVALRSPSAAQRLRRSHISREAWFSWRYALPTSISSLMGLALLCGLMIGNQPPVGYTLAAVAMWLIGVAAKLTVLTQLASNTPTLERVLGLLLVLVPLGACFIASQQLQLSALALGVMLSISFLGRSWSRLHATNWAPLQSGTGRGPFDGRAPIWWTTGLAIRLGTWVRPVRRLFGVVIVGACALAGVALAVRTSWQPFEVFISLHTRAVLIAAGFMIFAAAFAVGTLGASWYGLRSINCQLHLAYEMGIRKQTLVFASLASHLADAMVVTALAAIVCVGLGVTPSIALLLIPTVTVLSTAVGAACFLAEPGPDGAPSMSAPGLAVGMGLSLLGLLVALHPALSLAAAPAALALVGGAAWVFHKALEDASFSIT